MLPSCLLSVAVCLCIDIIKFYMAKLVCRKLDVYTTAPQRRTPSKLQAMLRQTVSRPVRVVSGPHLEPRPSLLSDLHVMGRPAWRENGSVLYLLI
jgi:hypothetical protein